jgi:hypothetical protein
MTELQQELKCIAELRRDEWMRMLNAPATAGFSKDQIEEAEIAFHEAQVEYLRSFQTEKVIKGQS